MSKPITVRCELSGSCEIELCHDEVDGMTDEEIREWVHEGAHMEFWEQGRFDIRLRDFDAVLKRFKRGDA